MPPLRRRRGSRLLARAQSPRLLLRVAGTSGAALLAGLAHASCGSAFCAVDTGWGAGPMALDEGDWFDLRYERIRQDEPRTGSRRIGVGAIPRHHDEVRTLNQNLVATFSHTFAPGWSVDTTLPFVDRDHLHIHNHRGAQLPERWSFRELGDMVVTGRYQRALESSAEAPRLAGVFLGLKLPTGKTDVANTEGEVAERSLQPGSGTTDLVAGVFYRQHLAAGGPAWFTQLQVRVPLRSHDGYRPGAQAGLDLGYAHPFTDRLSGIVQLNAVVKRRDRGANAEPEDSGSRSLFLSPGLAWSIDERWRVYGYYQQPLRQSVNGVQLTARGAIVAGVSTRF